MQTNFEKVSTWKDENPNIYRKQLESTINKYINKKVLSEYEKNKMWSLMIKLEYLIKSEAF